MTTSLNSTRPTSPAFRVGLAVLVVGALAAILAALLLAFGGIGRSSGTGGTGHASGGSSGSHSVATWPQPAAVEQVQRELGQLNYYEGSVDGLIGPQTVHALEYLQRDAGLPQTGQFTPATQAALANFMAHGNNQMGN